MSSTEADAGAEDETPDLRALLREAMAEFVEQRAGAPAGEIEEERRKREELERKVQELGEENRRYRAAAEEAESSASIRRELARLGVAKVELAYRAVRGDIRRDESGALVAEAGGTRRGLREYLAEFVAENPELLPARMSGGSGAYGGSLEPQGEVELEKIRPGMSSREMERIRQEITRVAAETLGGGKR